MLLINEVLRFLWIDNSAVMKMLQLFLHCIIDFLSKSFESLFDTVLGKDGIICDDVGWWIGFNKGSDVVEDVDIGLVKIMEGTRTNNKVDKSHGALIGYFIIVVNSGGIL